MFFSHFAMQSNYLFQWMKPSLKVMIFLQKIDKAWHQFFGRTRQNCLTPHPLLDHWMHTLTHFASDKKKLIACARVRCKRRVDSVAASPRDYLVRRAAKNVISPPKTPPNPPPTPPKETTMQKSRVSCKWQEEVDSVCQGTVQEKSG